MARPRRKAKKEVARRENGGDEALALAERQPWDRQEDESSKAFEAFVLYRDMGSQRSLMKVAQSLHETSPRKGTVESVKTHLAQWSVRHKWVERIEAYEIAEDRRQRLAREEEIEAMRGRHTRAGEALTTIASLRLLGSRDDVPGVGKINRINPNDLRPDDVARMLVEGIKVERLSRGLPTDLTKSLDTISLREMSEIVAELVDAALPRIPQEQHEGYLREVREIGARRVRR